MKSRTASLQVAHQKGCANETRTGMDSVTGCTCTPSFYTLYRDAHGRKVKGDDGTGQLVGRTRKRRDAERWLQRLQQRINDGLGAPERQATRTFPAWVDEYKALLERRVGLGKLKPSTQRGYGQTLSRAVDAIGHVELRQIGEADLRRFQDSYAGATDPTVARGLRELSACLEAATYEKPPILEKNPVPAFAKRADRSRGDGKDPYTDEELPKLFAAIAEANSPVYVALCRTALTTGLRLGELVALSWADVDLDNRLLRVEHGYNEIDGLIAPKTKGSRATIYLIPAAVQVLTEWRDSHEVRPIAQAPVFVGPKGSRLNRPYVMRMLEKARVAAKIPKLGENGRPRSFHSFRFTYDRLMLQAEANPEWLRRQLRHSDMSLTLNHYASWQAKDMAAAAAKVPAKLPGI